MMLTDALLVLTHNAMHAITCRSNMMLRNMLAGATPIEAWKLTRSKIAEVIKLDLKVFPVYDLIVFSLVPKHVQALCTAFVCCLWNGYISSVTVAAARNKALLLKLGVKPAPAA
jgi:Mpv17 / PMP22 family